MYIPASGDHFSRLSGEQTMVVGNIPSGSSSNPLGKNHKKTSALMMINILTA
jgi:hypothetical protein